MALFNNVLPKYIDEDFITPNEIAFYDFFISKLYDCEFRKDIFQYAVNNNDKELIYIFIREKALPYNDTEEIEWLITEFNIKPDYNNNEFLDYACSIDDFEMVEFLLKSIKHFHKK